MAYAYTAIVGGFSYRFDFENFVIGVDANLNAMPIESLYTAIKEAQASELGVVHEPIAYAEGLAEIGDGIETFITVKLMGEWELNSEKSSGKFEVAGGNLIKDNGKDPFLDNPLITYIAFFSQAGVKAIFETGVSGVIPQDLQDFANVVMTYIMANGDTFKQNIDAIKTETEVVKNDLQDGGRLDLILDNIDSNVSSVLLDTGTTIPGLIANLNDISVGDIFTHQMTESYAADGVAPTLEQSLFLIQQELTEFEVSGVTWTTKQLDGVTTAATFTLNDATSPTSKTRTS